MKQSKEKEKGKKKNVWLEENENDEKRCKISSGIHTTKWNNLMQSKNLLILSYIFFPHYNPWKPSFEACLLSQEM